MILLAVHLSIPFVVLMRLSLGLGRWFVPVMPAATVAGQLLGSWLYTFRRARRAVAQTESAD